MKTFTAFTQAARQIIFNKIRMIFYTFLTNNFDSDCTCCVSCKNDTMICFHDPYMENGSLAWRDTRWDHLFCRKRNKTDNRIRYGYLYFLIRFFNLIFLVLGKQYTKFANSKSSKMHILQLL